MSARAAVRTATVALSAVLLTLAATTRGQEAGPAPREGDTISEYVVRPGDTLEKVTEKLLGSASLWPENWRLNPGLKDPERLRVGQRLRVITHRVLPQRTAEVTKVARRVEEKPHPDPWAPARVGSILKEKDGIRTYESSSAELAFDDGSLLTLTEDSLVFLREVSSSVTGARRQSLEILEGQADLSSRPKQPRRSDIEILVGQARLKPEADAARGAQARARRAASGAQVMVYAGRGEVEAGGAKVTVASGMGTSVPEAGPPRAPERLLSRPRLQSPPPGSEWTFANPSFAWAIVPGAASYTLEICQDPGCAQLLLRVAALREPAWTPQAALPQGRHFWRVTAVSVSGLDGYPPPGSPFAVLSDRIDAEPPVIAVRVDGSYAPGPDGSVVLGRGARLLVEAQDDAAGVAELGARWDGGRWQRLPGGPVEPPPDDKAHVFEVRAVDRLGRQARPLSLAVRRALAPPAPPLVRGEPGRSHSQELR